MRIDKHTPPIADPVKIKTVYGDTYYVSAADLAGTKTMIRLFNKKGQIIIASWANRGADNPAYIHRENIAS